MGALERRVRWKAALSTVGVFLQEERPPDAIDVLRRVLCVIGGNDAALDVQAGETVTRIPSSHEWS
jgi:hypothetical protein